MALTKPNQDLRRDLQGLASDLKWSAVELKRIAERLSHVRSEAKEISVKPVSTAAPATGNYQTK
ncbi:hypothetical protein [Pseudomonas defluvii]|uniref:hypothetical protein n=1 Tax=Pseudomonas defluvii TaxID=1876757 RepID=UPI00390596F0